jgi:hypothetical protein
MLRAPAVQAAAEVRELQPQYSFLGPSLRENRSALQVAVQHFASLTLVVEYSVRG